MKTSLIVLLLFSALPSLGNDIITNNPQWNGSDYISPWGNGGATPTYGETIYVPSDGNDVLDSFTFYIFGNSPSIDFRAYVQPWGGDATVESPVYTSPVETVNTASGATTYTVFPDVALQPYAPYAIYISTIGVANTNSDEFDVGLTYGNTYTGQFIDNNIDSANPAAGNISNLNYAPSWGVDYFDDLAFTATFSGAAPEPATFVFAGLALALLGIAGLARRGRDAPLNS